MSTRPTQDLTSPSIEERAVVAYLRDHPQFFANHAGLLGDMIVPHAARGAVSLIERQVEVLRDQNSELKGQLRALVQVARDNDQLNERVQRLTLALAEARHLDDILLAMTEHLRSDFRSDYVALRLFSDATQPPDSPQLALMDVRQVARDDEAAEAYAALIYQHKPLCGHLRRSQSLFLFGAHAEEVASAVVLPLTAPPSAGGEGEPTAQCYGLLGIGSRDAQRFHAAMGTLFLTHLGALIGRNLWPHLQGR